MQLTLHIHVNSAFVSIEYIYIYISWCTFTNLRKSYMQDDDSDMEQWLVIFVLLHRGYSVKG